MTPSKKKEKSTETDWLRGFKNGQVAMARRLLDISVESFGDLGYVLEKLKRIADVTRKDEDFF